MITFVLTYRNRELYIVRNCLQSLGSQSSKDFKVILVDYGSSDEFSFGLEKLVNEFDFIQLIYVDCKKMLWNKSRAINIALNQSDSEFVFVGDIDMIYNKDFVKKISQLKSKNEVFYFQVGFLNKEESLLTKNFEDYNLKHLSSPEATGMTLYPSKLLKDINGYDEFYHGWGAEDSDVHRRLEHLGCDLKFYENEVLILHQWHKKVYRSTLSTEPYHSNLEKINHKYYSQTIESKKIKANERFERGKRIEKIDSFETKHFKLTNERNEIDAFLNGFLLDNSTGFSVLISLHPEDGSFKNSIKRILGKKYKQFYSFNDLNDLMLMSLIANFRNNYYEYEWDKMNETIELKISL